MTDITTRRMRMRNLPLVQQQRKLASLLSVPLCALLLFVGVLVDGSSSLKLDYHYQVPCPNNGNNDNNNNDESSSVLMGYTSLRDLNLELQRHASQTFIRESMMTMTTAASSSSSDYTTYEYVYTLCPHTVFNAWSSEEDDYHPIVPSVVSKNTMIKCGRNGDSRDGCLIHGGRTHVLIVNDGGEDQQQQQQQQNDTTLLYTFQGITFHQSQESSIAAVGSNMTRAEFIDCHWRETAGFATILLAHGHAVYIPRHVPNMGFQFNNDDDDDDDQSFLKKEDENLPHRRRRSLIVNNGDPRRDAAVETMIATTYSAMTVVLKDCTIQDTHHYQLDSQIVYNRGGRLEVYNLKMENNNNNNNNINNNNYYNGPSLSSSSQSLLFGFNIRLGGSFIVHDSHLVNTQQVSSTLIRGMTSTSIELYNSTIQMIMNVRYNNNGDEYPQQQQQQQQNERERKAIVAAMDGSTLIVKDVSMEAMMNNNNDDYDDSPSVSSSSSSSSLFVPIIVVNHSWAISIDGLCILAADPVVTTTLITDETCWLESDSYDNNSQQHAASCSDVASSNGGGIFVMESDWKKDKACWSDDDDDDEEEEKKNTHNNEEACPGFCLPLPKQQNNNDRCRLPLLETSSAGTSSSLHHQTGGPLLLVCWMVTAAALPIFFGAI